MIYKVENFNGEEHCKEIGTTACTRWQYLIPRLTTIVRTQKLWGGIHKLYQSTGDGNTVTEQKKIGKWMLLPHTAFSERWDMFQVSIECYGVSTAATFTFLLPEWDSDSSRPAGPGAVVHFICRSTTNVFWEATYARKPAQSLDVSHHTGQVTVCRGRSFALSFAFNSPRPRPPHPQWLYTHGCGFLMLFSVSMRPVVGDT